MGIRDIWQRIRSTVPVSLYPLLAPAHRWDRRRNLRRMHDQDARYRHQHPDVLVPDAELRFNVVGAYDIPSFLESGRRTADDIESAISHVGAALAGFTRGLDFGCGCGRFLQEALVRWPQIRWYGADVDARAIHWCSEHLLNATVVVNQAQPPLPFGNEQFDVIWCGAVFTHLDESFQDAWLTELSRVLSPCGYLLASLHGPTCWSALPKSTVRRIFESGFVFARTACDEGVHPDWYQTAWHTREYVESHWRKFFEIAAYLPQGYSHHQDLVVARKSV